MRHLILILIGACILFSSCEKNEVIEDERKNKNCDPGYTGVACTVEIPPKKIIISKIDVLWFDGGVADLSVRLEDVSGGDSFEYSYQTEEINGARSSSTHTFTLDEFVEMKNYDVLKVTIYDGNREIETLLYAYESEEGFPTTKSLRKSNGDVNLYILYDHGS